MMTAVTTAHNTNPMMLAITITAMRFSREMPVEGGVVAVETGVIVVPGIILSVLETEINTLGDEVALSNDDVVIT